MADANLVKYIKDSLAGGHQRIDIVAALLRAGWAQTMIDDGFLDIQREKEAQLTPKITPPISPAPIVTSQHMSSNTIQNTSQSAVQSVRPQIAEIKPATSAKMSASGLDMTKTFVQKKSYLRTAIISLVVLVLIGAGGGVAYSYFMKIGPFAKAPYTADNLVQGLLASVSRIDTSSYAISGSIATGPRDADAKSFVFNNATDEDFIKKYQRDVKRTRDIEAILQNLNTNLYKASTMNYPVSLKALAQKTPSTAYYKVNLTDPSGNLYEYKTTESGKNFVLSTVFETDSAIAQLKKTYQYTASTTPIDDKKATFTKDSYLYMYISTTPPKPFLANLNEMSAYLPAELKASLSASATTDWKKADADWKFNIDANGDFGDMTYKVNIDALKKDSDYYFKINNLPGLFSMFIQSFESIKGKWVKIDSATASSSRRDYFDVFSSIAAELPDAEKSYQENRQQLTEVLKKAAAIADEEHLFTLKNPPKSENINGRSLYRYDIKINKNAIVSFYKRLVNETRISEMDNSIIADAGYIEYLQSSEFNEIFNYNDKNTFLTIWVDAQGFPGMIRYTIRAVPPDMATQLKDKQINIVFKLELSNINKPVNIEAPKDAKPIEDLANSDGGNNALGDARLKSRDARRIADIKQLQLALELYADSNNQTYPKNLSDLVAQKYIPSIPTDPSDKSAYSYTYRTTGGLRDSYHVGVSLEDVVNYSLQNDNDCNSKTGSGCEKTTGWSAESAFNGNDEAGCKGEKDRACYDLIP